MLGDRLTELADRAQRDVDDGSLPSCQLAVAIDGTLVLDETFGTPETSRFTIFSVTKALMAGAIWLLMGDGRLDVSARVVDHLPSFATNGKEVVTIEQLLLHEAGFPHAPLGPPDWWTREGRLARFARWRLNWEPGTRVEYHPDSAHWVLGELIYAVTTVDHRDFVRSRIVEPLGLSSIALGVPVDRQADIVDAVRVGSAPSPEEVEEVTGMKGLDLQGMADGAVGHFNQPEVRALGVPGGGAVARAADVALFFQSLLDDRHGLWDPAVLADATGRVRTTKVDALLGVPANRSLGLLLAGDDGHAIRRGMGRTTSPQTFGHYGVGGQIAWADPTTGISFCYLTNGLDANPFAEGRRRIALCNRAGALTG